MPSFGFSGTLIWTSATEGEATLRTMSRHPGSCARPPDPQPNEFIEDQTLDGRPHPQVTVHGTIYQGQDLDQAAGLTEELTTGQVGVKPEATFSAGGCKYGP